MRKCTAFILCIYMCVQLVTGSLTTYSQDTVYGLSVPWTYEQCNGSPEPTPSPTPTPPPGEANIVVDDSGGEDYTTIGAAYAAASCGDLIWVRAGTYTLTAILNLNKTCSEGNEITIQNYPSEAPVVTCQVPVTTGFKRVEFNGQWNIWDGIEVKGCYDGLKVYQSNNTIKNSKIHHNYGQGILLTAAASELQNITIDNNEIYYNAYDEGTLNPQCGGSIKHCHGIYISDFGCVGTDGITITNNYIHDHGGRAIQWNGSGCSSLMDNTEVSGNTFENNSYNIILWYNVTNANVHDNDFILNSWPETDDSDHTHIGIRNSTGNTFNNNNFTTGITGTTVYHFKSFDTTSASQTLFNNNDWIIPSGANSNRWIWNGSARTDFSTNWKSVTGWDANGTITVQ